MFHVEHVQTAISFIVVDKCTVPLFKKKSKHFVALSLVRFIVIKYLISLCRIDKTIREIKSYLLIDPSQ